MLCEYCNDLEGIYEMSNGKMCCEPHFNKCPGIKKKNSDALKKAYKEGRKDCSQFDGKRGWAKGLSKETDERVKKQSDSVKRMYESGELIPSFLGKTHSDDTKKKMSEKRIEIGSARRGIYEHHEATLYYIKVNDLYKFGITYGNVQSRFSKDISKGIKIETIFEVYFEDGAEAFDIEQAVHKLNTHNRYKGKKILVSGNSELFTEEINYAPLAHVVEAKRLKR